jgi:hypothetical protein
MSPTRDSNAKTQLNVSAVHLLCQIRAGEQQFRVVDFRAESSDTAVWVALISFGMLLISTDGIFAFFHLGDRALGSVALSVRSFSRYRVHHCIFLEGDRHVVGNTASAIWEATACPCRSTNLGNSGQVRSLVWGAKLPQSWGPDKM